MGRHAQGWSLTERGRFWHVRFRHEKRRYHISTGESDRERAGSAAAKIYADVTQGKRRHALAARFALAPLRDSVAEWLASLEGVLDEQTVATYTGYAARWLELWQRLDEAAHPASLADYVADRLRAALAKTVRKELSALFGFFGWCVDHGLLSETPARPTIRKTVRGTRVGHQREKAPDYSPEQIAAALAALPEWGGKGDNRFPVRARFVVAYETGLRPATLDALTWGHIERGCIRVDDKHDKARFGREVPLSRVASAAIIKAGLASLINAAPGEADPNELIFGRHDYRPQLAKAAEAAGLPSLSPYDLRHARATHLVEAGHALSSVAFLLGHKQLTTTNRYAKATERGVVAMLGAGVSGDDRDQSEGPGVRGTRIERARVFSSLEPESSGTSEITADRHPESAQKAARNAWADRGLGALRPKGFAEAVGVMLGLCAARGVEVTP